MPPVCYVASMSRNRLTKPSNSARTYHEHGRSFRSKGCQAEDGSGVGCLGNVGKLEHDVAPWVGGRPREQTTGQGWQADHLEVFLSELIQITTILEGAIGGFRLMIRRRLGLADKDEIEEPEPELTPDELRVQGERLMAHADELRRYLRERTPR
jgi:hypothetical protein